MFADDLVLFAEASEEQALIIQDCLNKFSSMSGQKVNQAKSRILLSSNVDARAATRISDIIGIPCIEDLGKYLGVPTLSKRVTRATFQHILDRVEKRLSGWRTKFLSLAGRVTLIRTTVAAIPAYTMQTCRLPRSVCDDLDRKIRRFLWAGTSGERKAHLVAWATVTRSVSEGGLGIPASRELNSASMAKLGWRMLQEPEALWVRVLRHHYCKGRLGIDTFTKHPTSSNLWRGICENQAILQKGMAHSIGNGHHTLFWRHRWATTTPLMELASQQVPERDRAKTVADYWQPDTGWRWDELAELLPDAIQGRVVAFQVYPTLTLNDSLFWGATASGQFTI